jgi:hypothetical protein
MAYWHVEALELNPAQSRYKKEKKILLLLLLFYHHCRRRSLLPYHQ